MKKVLFTLLLIFFIIDFTHAQVGVNTVTPNAMLDIKASNQATPANTDGILIPKIDAFPAINPTAAQKGMLVYLTTLSGGNPPGFYYWNNPGWVGIVSGTGGGTLDQSYDFGGAGLGKTITADTGAVTIAGTDGLVSMGTSGTGAIAPSGSGTRMVWNPRKSAFRAGEVGATEWDDVNIGQFSMAFGSATRASGTASAAWGANSIAAGSRSTTWGFNNTSIGQLATAFGESNTAVNDLGTVWGRTNTARGLLSTAWGVGTEAGSFAETVLGTFPTIIPVPSINNLFAFNNADRLFVVGNGFSAANRSDALVILKSGDASFGKSLFVNGNSSPLGGLLFGSEFGGNSLISAQTAAGVPNNLNIRANAIPSNGIFITSLGNVGINEPNPTARLHVSQSLRLDLPLAGANKVLTSDALGNASWQNPAAVVETDPEVSVTTTSRVPRWNGTTLVDGVLFDNATNVGVGTSVPADRLHVVGNIRMVDGNQAAGKVFTSDANGTATWQNAAANAWGLTGNTGTNPATNFIGTTDNQDVIFKRFNVQSGSLGTTNTSFGLNALNPTSSGILNTAIGSNALQSNTSGNSNTAVGRNALLSNSTGDSNTSIGANTLGANTTGSANTANGNGALNRNTIGSENTAVGNAALIANIDGISNTSIGMESMLRNISGNNNSAIGKFALANNISGSSNSAFGRASLIENTTGSFNTASGQSSLADNTTGSNNTATGYQALRSNTVGSENTALGYLSDVGSTNLTNATSIGARAEVTVSNALVLGSINGVNSATSGVNVGIGTTAPADRLHVVGNIRMVDGNQAAGKVFTSDANGTATWQTPAAAGTTLDGAYDFGGAGAGRTITADTGAVTIDGTDGLVSTGTIGTGATAPSGAGTRMVWNPKSAAFRVGIASGTQWDDFNIGAASIAFGANTIAFGTNSTAFGNGTTASASSSTAFGSGTAASGTFSIAFGNGTTASGNISTAFGNSSVASGSSSTAFGERNTAPSFGEIVLGIGATTYTPSVNGATQFRAANITDRLFVVGNALDANINNTVDPAERSDALVILKNGLTRLPSTTNAMITASDGKAVVTKEYLAANTSGTLDQAYDFGGAGAGSTITADAGSVTIAGTDGLVSTGTANSGAVAPSGAGTRMVWNPRKQAFRAGAVAGAQWDDANIGFRSVAMGISTTASGFNSAAFGDLTVASNDASIAMGSSTIASGPSAFAMGNFTTASGPAAFSVGGGTTASGTFSIAAGRNNTASSYGETVLGIGATTYTPTVNGAITFRTSNATDRLLVVGNAIDADSDNFVDPAERSDALVILKDGLTRLPSTTNAMITASDGKAVVTKEYLAANTSGTLDQSYDFGGAGAGRTITADSGAVTIAGTDGLVSIGVIGAGALAPSTGGTYMMWNPRKSSFRAGTLSIGGTNWDDVNLGINSVGFGFRSTASGNASASIGFDNTSSSFGEVALGIGATTYTPSVNGATQFRAANGADRLLVVGNAVDANNNNLVDVAERSDALVILKNGNTGIGTSTPETNLEIVAANKFTATFGEGNLHVVSNNPQNTDIGGSISLGGFGSSTTATSVFATVEGRKSNAGALSDSGYLAFKTNDVGVLTERMRITQDGNVGIGIASAQTALDIVGAMTVRSFVSPLLTADNQVVPVGTNGNIWLQSNSLAVGARTITLGDGIVTGQLLTLRNINNIGNFEVSDDPINRNTNTIAGGRTLGIDDFITLMWVTTHWSEVSFADN